MEFEKINVLNFRELGGIVNNEGRRVKEGLFYRGGPFYNTDRQTQRLLNTLNIKYVFDLRSSYEVRRKPDTFVPDSALRIHANALDFNLISADLDMFSGPNKDKNENWMLNFYSLLPFGNVAFKLIFDHIVNNDLPIYFHCMGGKDRTGVMAALILTLLDVDREKIIENYLVSYDNMVKEYGGAENCTRNMLVFREWIETAFEAIEERYPSMEEFFLKEYNIDKQIKQKIKDNCLE